MMSQNSRHFLSYKLQFNPVQMGLVCVNIFLSSHHLMRGTPSESMKIYKQTQLYWPDWKSDKFYVNLP